MKIHRIEDLRKELEVLKEGSKKVWCVSVPTHKFPTTSEYHCHKVFECFGLSFTQKGSNQQLRMPRSCQFSEEIMKNFKIEVMKKMNAYYEK